MGWKTKTIIGSLIIAGSLYGGFKAGEYHYKPTHAYNIEANNDPYEDICIKTKSGNIISLLKDPTTNDYNSVDEIKERKKNIFGKGQDKLFGNIQKRVTKTLANKIK